MAVAACSAAVIIASAGGAAAGEITGNGKSLAKVPITEGGETFLVIKGKSICAYSGLNDERVLGDESAPRVQTPAEAVQFGMPGISGYFCNPTGKRTLPD